MPVKWFKLEGESCEYPWLGGVGKLLPPEIEALRQVYKLLPFKRIEFTDGLWIHLLKVDVSPWLWVQILDPILGPSSEGILDMEGRKARIYQVNGSALWYWIGHGTYAFHVSQIQLRAREANERYKAQQALV